MRNVPPISLISLLILWFGIGETSKLIVIVLASVFPMYLNISKGFRECDKKLMEVGKTMGFSKMTIFFKICLPYAREDILVGRAVTAVMVPHRPDLDETLRGIGHGEEGRPPPAGCRRNSG